MTDGLDWLRGGGAEEPSSSDLELLAEIHATVDLERALADAGLAGAAGADELLGARVVVIRGSGRSVAVAEPSTEGRLARTLAEHGEGLAGRYLRAPMSVEEVARHAASAGVAVSRPRNGPFGREILVLGGSAAGPHVLLVEPRTVPSRR